MNVFTHLSNVQLKFFFYFNNFFMLSSGGSRADVTSKIERFVIIVNGFQITKRSILDVAAFLDPSLFSSYFEKFYHNSRIQFSSITFLKYIAEINISRN